MTYVRMTKSTRFSIAYAKWTKHTLNIRDHFYNLQSPLVGNIRLTFTKHFIQRIVERSGGEDEQTFIRRILYHAFNTRIWEILFWYYSDNEKDILIRKDDKCLVLDRGVDGTSIIVRTFYTRKGNLKKDGIF